MDSIVVPVAAGLAVGIGLILIFSLISFDSQEPVMFLRIADDGRSYKAYFNAYCGTNCDIFIHSRVLSQSAIEIDNDLEIALRANNAFRQPNELHFIIQQYSEDLVYGGIELDATNFSFSKLHDGYYSVDSLPSGKYIVNVIADWNNDDADQELTSHSLHRFRVIVN